MEAIYKKHKVSSEGIIYTLKGIPMIGSLNSKGYRRVTIENKNILLHRIVAQLFVSNLNNLPQVNHIDGNKLNNDYTNLEWMTDKQNREHARLILGIHTFLPGQNHPKAKLRDQDIREILLSKDKPKLLADKYNVSTITIYKILSREYWKHIEIN